MEMVQLNSSLPAMSRLIYGVWRLADDENTSTAHVRAKIDACLEQGITTFDHADIYGEYQCEKVFGQALAEDSSLRDQMQIISKCDIAIPTSLYPERRVKYYDTSPEYIRMSVENSLRNLNTDSLDLLLIHRPDPFMDATATGATLDELIKEGKIKGAGVSNFKPSDWELLQSRMDNTLVTNQIEMSLLERDAFTNGDLAHLQTLNLHAMAWSPLAGGRIFGNDADAQRLQPILKRIADEQNCDIDHVAVAWLLAHPSEILPIVGTNNLDRVKTMSKAMDVEIDRQTWFELLTAAAGEEVA
ncbi:aldo/keto reductase [Leucothrix arctica]|uniref:Oxidoreductase n=1 Tax=Leucothrix arctica TaxID=1481894 RepID=A0A317CLV3_9GAMM|nr:aldo/keto reductase [Leucothrix arctica]PWQ99359.1 oxidoreductase [Leucothrix arctica]